jgi:hypothetical protein
MKFLIVGLGSVGRRHLQNLVSLGERDILLNRRAGQPSSSLADEELSAFPVETDLQAALAHRPDAVIVSNPTAMHLPAAIAAAQAGCAILIEKPVSHSLEGVDRLRSALKQSGAPLLVGFQFRFHPGLQKVADLLKVGAIGITCAGCWEKCKLCGRLPAAWVIYISASKTQLKSVYNSKAYFRLRTACWEASIWIIINSRPRITWRSSALRARSGGIMPMAELLYSGLQRRVGNIFRLRPASSVTIYSWTRCAISWQLSVERSNRYVRWKMAYRH